MRDGGRGEPEQHERDGGADSVVAPMDHGDQRGDGENDASEHAQVHAPGIQIHCMFGLRGRDPLQEISARDHHTKERAKDGVGHEPRLIGHET